MTSERRFVFLRAVNLGRRNVVPMKALVAAIDDAGLGPARFLLQSGNLIVPAARTDDAGLKGPLEKLVLERFDVATKAIVRTPDELRDVLEANPFPPPDGGSVQIAMWDERPDPAGLEALAAGDYGLDRLHLREREAILLFAEGSQRSKLGNALVERRLGVPATARNVRTLERLLARDG